MGDQKERKGNDAAKSGADGKKWGKRWKWWAAGAAVLLVLWFAGVRTAERIIRKNIERQEFSVAGQTYAPQVERVRVRLIPLSVKLGDVHLQAKESGAAPVLSASVRQVEVRGIRFGKTDGGRRIRLGSVRIQSPYAAFESLGAAGDSRVGKTPGTPDASGSAQASGGRIASIAVARLEIEDGNFQYAGGPENPADRYTLTGLMVRGEGLQVSGDSSLWGGNQAEADSLRAAGEGGTRIAPAAERFTAEDLRVSVPRFRRLYRSGAMMMEVDSLYMSLKDSLISVSAVRMLPQYGQYEYARKVADHADWTQAVAGPVEVRGLDPGRLLAEKVLHIDSVWVGSAEIRSYKNRKIGQALKVKPLSWVELHRLPVKVEVPVIALGNIDVAYEELSARGTEPGVVTVTGITGKVEGLTNLPSGPGGKNSYHVDIRGKLMDEGMLQAHVRLPADSSDTRFEVTGTLGRMDMRAYNRMLLPLLGLEIARGTCHEVKFDIRGDAVRAESRMSFLYDDLKVELYRKERGRRKEMEILSDLVNDVVIHAQNPDRHGRERTGHGTFERDPYKSQFNYMWKTAFAGVKEIVLAL